MPVAIKPVARERRVYLRLFVSLLPVRFPPINNKIPSLASDRIVVRVGITRRLADINRLDSLPWAAPICHWHIGDIRLARLFFQKDSRLIPARSIPTLPNRINKNIPLSRDIFIYVVRVGISLVASRLMRSAPLVGTFGFPRTLLGK